MAQAFTDRSANSTRTGQFRPRRPAARVLWWLSLGNLALAVGLFILIKGVSENWWLSNALVYLPRSLHLIPSLILLPCSCFLMRRALLVNLAAALLIAGPVMGARVNIGPFAPPRENPERRLCVVSCNVQEFRPQFDLIVRELEEIHPDIVVLQEAHGTHPRFEEFFNTRQTAGDVTARLCRTTAVEGTQCKLCTRLTDGLCSHDTNG